MNHKCIYQSSFYNFDETKITPATLILLHGGGNFGDLWNKNREFRNRIINRYYKNKIILLPQTVYYSDTANLKNDADYFSKCENLTVCVRDLISYSLVKRYFNNEVLLLPDLAFYLTPTVAKAHNKVLFLLRKDQEINTQVKYIQVPANAQIHEWPTMEKNDIADYAEYFIRLAMKCDNRAKRVLRPVLDWYWKKILFPHNISRGINFINNYSTIYTTRLHGAILAILLDKKVFLYDNSYGKNSSFYETWLRDLDTLTMLK